MPLLLAIVKAISHPDYDWRGNSTQQPLQLH